MHELSKAIYHLEQDREEIRSAILVFFLGIGSILLEEANASLSNREAELSNESEKDTEVAEATEVCDIAWEAADGLDAAARHTAETTQLDSHLNRLVALQTRIASINSPKNGPGSV